MSLARSTFVLVAVLLAAVPASAGIAGGKHDFTRLTGGRVSNPCQFCHVTANGARGTVAPKWNLARSANSSYVTYDHGNSATFKALQLSARLGSSVACLSCHDGSVAINQKYVSPDPGSGGGANAPVYAPSFAIETASRTYGDFDPAYAGSGGPQLGRNDLTHMHPVGISYAMAAMRDPTLNPIPPEGTTFAQMLKGSARSVECSSCHDIHGTVGDSANTPGGLIVTLDHSALCETCHRQ